MNEVTNFLTFGLGNPKAGLEMTRAAPPPLCWAMGMPSFRWHCTTAVKNPLHRTDTELPQE
jgi:hypothetical protein